MKVNVFVELMIFENFMDSLGSRLIGSMVLESVEEVKRKRKMYSSCGCKMVEDF